MITIPQPDPDEQIYAPGRHRTRFAEFLTKLLDEEIVSGNLRPFDVQQTVQSLVRRYEQWSDGCVPDDIFDDLVDRWHEGDMEQELHEFLGITWEQFAKAEEDKVVRAKREERYRKAEEEFGDRVVNGDCHSPNRDYWARLRSRQQVQSGGADSEGDPPSDGQGSEGAVG